MINPLAIVWATGAALGSFLVGNTGAFQAHTSLDKAAKSLSLGSYMPVSATSADCAQVLNFADAQVDIAKGALITTADPSVLKPSSLGPGIYHPYDYSFYYFNLRENAANRISKYQLNLK